METWWSSIHIRIVILIIFILHALTTQSSLFIGASSSFEVLFPTEDRVQKVRNVQSMDVCIVGKQRTS